MGNRSSKRTGTAKRATTAATLIRERLGRLRPKLAMILGSGFHGVTAMVKPKACLAYTDMPHFPKTGVKGHSGQLIVGTVGDMPVMILSGRAHYYEGHGMEEITFPVRVMAELGVTDLLVTNAAGGIDRKFQAGDFMLLKDHLNLMGANPLRPVSVGDWDGTFLDLSQAYDAGLAKLMKRAGRAVGVKLREGVYAAVSGPSYETPAEIRMFDRLGANAVGMSTVPEVIMARQCGLRVAGVSLITNAAAGISDGIITHAEVLDTGKSAETAAQQLISRFCQLYAKL
jgi:purine-nucleoside phosphorylase